MKTAIPLNWGGLGNMVEGDGMFLIGKRKCDVGRFHSKEHVYMYALNAENVK